MHGLTPELAARFYEHVAQLVEPQHMRLGLAVSGGPDSLALLLLAHAAFPGRIAAATVDHGLRAESADEAAQVANYCATLGVPHATLRPPTPITGSVQAAARAIRYQLLNAWCDSTDCTWLATAHHADDQAETLLMRLNRGAGVAGLSGVRPMNGRIIRPLLRWRRSELAAIVAGAGWRACDDPSNHDMAYDRVRVRAGLADADWINVPRLGLSAQWLAEADTGLDWAAKHLAETRLKLGSDAVRLDPALLPRELRRRLSLIALHHLDPDAAPRGDALMTLIEALGRGETRTIGTLLAKGGAVWRFSRATPRAKK